MDTFLLRDRQQYVRAMQPDYVGGYDIDSTQNTSTASPSDERHGRISQTPYDCSSSYQQSQFSPENSYTAYRSFDSSGNQQTVTPSMMTSTLPTRPDTQWGPIPQLETALFNSPVYPSLNTFYYTIYFLYPPGVYSPHVEMPSADFTTHSVNPTTYMSINLDPNPSNLDTYFTNGSMQQYLPRYEQAPALSNNIGTYSSAEVSVETAVAGLQDMSIGELEYQPVYHNQARTTAAALGGDMQVAQQGECDHDSSSCQACTGVHSCSNRSPRRGPQQPLLPLVIPFPSPPSSQPSPTPPPPTPAQHDGGGDDSIESGTNKVMIGYCPIALCNRGVSNARPFPRTCNLLEHLRGVHGEIIPPKTKLRKWFPEQGYEPDAYLARVRRK